MSASGRRITGAANGVETIECSAAAVMPQFARSVRSASCGSVQKVATRCFDGDCSGFRPSYCPAARFVDLSLRSGQRDALVGLPRSAYHAAEFEMDGLGRIDP